MKKTLLLLTLMLAVHVQAQVENYAIRLAQGGSIDCGIMPELNGRDAYALQFWMNADEWTEGATLLQRGEGLRVWLSGKNKLTATVGDCQLTLNSTFLVPDRWNHIMLLSDATKIYIYINGNRAKTLTAHCIIPEDNESSFVIGGDQYKGRIDEIRIWNTAPIDTYNYFVHTTLNKWVPQLDNLVAYFKGDQELCPNLVDYKALFDPSAPTNHHGIFSASGATLEKVTDNAGLPYLLNGAYCDNARFYDRGVDRDKYLLANDLIILGINSYADGHLQYTSPCDHATIEHASYLAEFEGRKGVLNLEGEGACMTLPTTAFNPTLTDGVASQGYTFETWLYLDEWTEGAYLFRRETDDGNHGFSISLGNAERKEIIVKVNGKRFVNQGCLHAGQWQHLAVTTLQGGNARQTFLFMLNGKAYYADVNLSDNSTNYTPTGMDGCVPCIGKGLKGKLDETVIWDQKFTAAEISTHMTSIPMPALSKVVTARLLARGLAFYTYDNPQQLGYDSYSQDEWRRIMLSAYEGYRGYQVRISVRGHTNWQTTISNAARRKIFAADLARLSEGYDGVELDLEWMDGTQTNLGLLADDILEALPEGKTLMISCHAYGAYQFPKAKISKIDGFTFQQYGPQNTFTKWSNFTSSYNSFVNYGFPKEKIYLSYSTTTSRGYDSSGTAQGDVVGVRKDGFLNEDSYTPTFDADYETCQYDGYTYYFMGPGQVYRRAKHCVDNNLQGIFYWDLGNDVKTSNPYSLPKASNYGLNCNVDSLVTTVTINHPTPVSSTLAPDDEAKIHLRVSKKMLTADLPSGAIPGRIVVYSLSGKQVASSHSSSVAIGALPKGVYVVRLVLTDGTCVNKKFCKE